MSEKPAAPEPACPTERGVLAQLALHGVLWANVVAALTVVVPRFEREFDAVQLQLPLSCEKVLAVSHWFQQCWHVIALLSVPALAAEGALLLLLGRSAATRRLARYWSAAVTTLLVVGAVGVALAILMPWAKLQGALSQ